jgi:hypothetical protein
MSQITTDEVEVVLEILPPGQAAPGSAPPPHRPAPPPLQRCKSTPAAVRYLQPTAFSRNGKATGIEGICFLKGALSETKPKMPTTLPKSTLECTIMGNNGATTLVSAANPMPYVQR